MYSNDQAQIRAGLVNYIGSILASSKFDNDKAARHSVVALLLEEVVKLMKDDDGYFDMYVSKPALRLTAGIAKQRYSLMETIPTRNEAINKQIDIYKFINTELEEILKNINN